MWADAAADPAQCPGSGTAGHPADPLADGYPHGRALCPTCLRFIPLVDGRLSEHETSDPDETEDEVAHRRDWLNTHGW